MSPTLRAALWMLGAIVSFSSMAVAGREVSVTLDTFEIMMYRSAIGLVIVAAVLSVTGHWRAVRTDHLKRHILRNAAHFTGQNLWFFAVTAAPLAQVFALEFTTPIWVVLLAPLLLGEPLTRRRTLAVVLGFVGILIVARPGAETVNAGTITAALAAVFFALTYIATKRLTRLETIGGIMFWLTALQLVFGLAAAGFDGDIALPDAAALPFVVVIALAGLQAHFCITKELSLASASIVAPLDFVRLPAIAVIGMALYDEPLDLFVFLGAAVIFAANYVNILGENRKDRVAETPGAR